MTPKSPPVGKTGEEELAHKEGEEGYERVEGEGNCSSWGENSAQRKGMQAKKKVLSLGEESSVEGLRELKWPTTPVTAYRDKSQEQKGGAQLN